MLVGGLGLSLVSVVYKLPPCGLDLAYLLRAVAQMWMGVTSNPGGTSLQHFLDQSACVWLLK